jgi:hypothetical protein
MVGIAILIAAAYIVYRSVGKTAEISVVVGMNGCVDTSCLTLPLPEADVTVAFADGQMMSSKTDATGTAHFQTRRAGEVAITATSPLLSEPVTTTAKFSTGEYVSVDLTDPAPFKLVRTK